MKRVGNGGHGGTAMRPRSWKHLVDKEDTRHELGHALVDVPVHHPVDLGPQLFGDLGLLLLHHLAHHAHHILPALRPRVRRVQVMQRHVLHDLCEGVR